MKSWVLMKKKLLNLFNRGFLINQLMQLYSLILVVVIFIIMTGLSLFLVNTTQKNAEYTIDNAETELITNLKSKDSNVVSNILGELAFTPSHYENTYNFITMNQQDYFDYMLNLWHETGVSTYFPDIVRTVFINYTEIKSLDIVFDDHDYYLHADKSSVLGTKMPKPYNKPTNELTLVRAITEPSTSQAKGAIYVTFTDESLASIYNQKKENHLSSFVFNSNKEIIYDSQEEDSSNLSSQIKSSLTDKNYVTKEDLDNKYMVRNASVKDLSVVILMNKQELRKTLLKQIVPILLIGFSAMALLLIFLNKIFKKYSTQVETIVQVTNQVSQGDLTAQVDTSLTELELKDLAEAVNQMVVNLNTYIEDIYLLEIKQRDAHMRALQSQINPHFLYNTLEYIRMYALSNQQTELADVVYAFSALLRNNITQEKTTTLKEELDFCEKYVYLYQMRYPDSIAYHFLVDDGLDKFVIPKFIIQPLIENYFVHGIDYERQDNAISVKARKLAEEIEIRIIDNGVGMSQARLAEVNNGLNQTKSIEIEGSIGMSNVYERIKGVFGESTKMWVESEPDKGVTIVIKIRQ